jgi:hypothetical protein
MKRPCVELIPVPGVLSPVSVRFVFSELIVNENRPDSVYGEEGE